MTTTLADILDQVSSIFDLSPNAPSTSTDDYSRRIKLVNMNEKNWANKMDYRWRVLLTSSSVTILANTTSIALPADFSISGLVTSRVGNISDGTDDWQLVRPKDRSVYNASEKIAWITGNDIDGYTLNIQPTSASNITFTFDYYSNYLATDASSVSKSLMTTSTDKTKCPSPNYLVYSTVADLYRTDEDPVLADSYVQKAELDMANMIASENMVATGFNDTMMTEAELTGGANIGE